MGDLFSDINDAIMGKKGVKFTSSTQQCVDQANNSTQVAQIDAQTLDLAKNWNPTGFYTAADLAAVVQQIGNLVDQARAALASAPQSTSDASTAIAQATDNLNKATSNLTLYTNAIASAKAQGTTAINAPGLKTWVTNSMVDVSQAFVTASVLQCETTWLDRAVSLFTSAYNFLKRIVGVVLKAGDLALKVADDVLGLYDVLKWGAIGVGALYAIKWLKPMLRRS